MRRWFQVTECEIFLSLIVKFLDPDKPTWQRALALEVLHKMTVQADLLTNFCECYDLKPHATNIFQDIVNSLGAYVHSLFVNPQMMNQATMGKICFASNDEASNRKILTNQWYSDRYIDTTKYYSTVHGNAYRPWGLAPTWFLLAWHLAASGCDIHKWSG